MSRHIVISWHKITWHIKFSHIVAALFTCSSYNSWERHRDGNICNSNFHNPEPGGATLCHHVASWVKLNHHIWTEGQVHRQTTLHHNLHDLDHAWLWEVFVQGFSGYLANAWQHDWNSINTFLFVCAIVSIGNVTKSVKLLDCWCAIAFGMSWVGDAFSNRRGYRRKKKPPKNKILALQQVFLKHGKSMLTVSWGLKCSCNYSIFAWMSLL